MFSPGSGSLGILGNASVKWPEAGFLFPFSSRRGPRPSPRRSVPSTRFRIFRTVRISVSCGGASGNPLADGLILGTVVWTVVEGSTPVRGEGRFALLSNPCFAMRVDPRDCECALPDCLSRHLCRDRTRPPSPQVPQPPHRWGRRHNGAGRAVRG